MLGTQTEQDYLAQTEVEAVMETCRYVPFLETSATLELTARQTVFPTHICTYKDGLQGRGSCCLFCCTW